MIEKIHVTCKNKYCQKKVYIEADRLGKNNTYFCNLNCGWSVAKSSFYGSKSVLWILSYFSLLASSLLQMILVAFESVVISFTSFIILALSAVYLRKLKERNVFYKTIYFICILWSPYNLLYSILLNKPLMNALEKPISLCAGFIEKIYSLLSGLLILLVTLFLIAIEKIFNALENPFAQLAVVVLFAIYIATKSIINAIENHNCR